MKSYIVEKNKNEALRLKKYAESKGYKCGEMITEEIKTARLNYTRYTIECEEN